MPFDNKKDAELARLKANNTILFDRHIKVQFKRNPKEYNQEANLFIKNIPKNTSIQELEEKF